MSYCVNNSMETLARARDSPDGGSRGCSSDHGAREPREDLRTPRRRPNEPSCAGSLAEGRRAVGVDGTTRDEQGHRVGRVGAFRRHEVAWSAVTATIGPPRVDAAGSSSPKNARSIAATTSRLSSRAAVVGGHVGALQVDVEGLGTRRGRPRPDPPRPRTPPRRRGRTRPGPGREHRRAPSRGRSRCLARRASRRSTPSRCRTARGWARVEGGGRRRRASGSGCPASVPPRDGRTLTSATSSTRAAPSTKAFVSSAERRAASRVGERLGRDHARLEGLEGDTEVAPHDGRPDRCSMTSAESGAPSSARRTSAPRCSTVACSSKLAPGSTRFALHLVGELVRPPRTRGRVRPAGRRSPGQSAVAKLIR